MIFWASAKTVHGSKCSCKMDNSVGLSNFLAGASKPPEVIQKTDNPNLAFMASGPLLANAADLLSGKRIFSLVSTVLTSSATTSDVR